MAVRRNGYEAALKLPQRRTALFKATHEDDMTTGVKPVVIHAVAHLTDHHVPGDDLSAGVTMRPKLKLISAEIARYQISDAVNCLNNPHG
jgi:hypothetical protein